VAPRLRHRSRPPVNKALARINAANAAAAQEPRGDSYINAIQVYAYAEGSLDALYAAPERVTDIALQAGEQLIAISAGDTTRWIIGNTHSGAGPESRVHVLVKPQVAGLKTNLVITTDRRTYHIQMTSTTATAMAGLSWRYPQNELIAIEVASQKAEVTSPTAEGIALDKLRFGYTITGDRPAWRPLRAFDDGEKVYIEFPASLSTTEAPPLFVIGKGGKAELTNYTVRRNYYIVDGLFEVAELRLGERPQAVVRLTAAPTTEGRHD
jgi:type IV secretion system protein VirB9